MPFLLPFLLPLALPVSLPAFMKYLSGLTPGQRETLQSPAIQRPGAGQAWSRADSRPESQEPEVETDSGILNRRAKQLAYCKRTEDYQAYSREIPKNKREQQMPRTPNMTRKYSRRQWDGAVKKWKTEVHAVGREILRSQPVSEP